MTPKVPKIPFSSDQLRAVAHGTLDVASLVDFVVQRAVEHARNGTAAPRRGRGQRLTPYEFRAIFVYACWFDERPRTVARVFGMDHGTVRRYLATARFRKFRDYTDRAVADHFSLRLTSLRARNVLKG